MSRREVWLSAGAIFLFAVVVRAIAAAAVAFPVPEDTAYYAGVARNLVEGRGLVSDALWSYQTQPLVVPRAAAAEPPGGDPDLVRRSRQLVPGGAGHIGDLGRRDRRARLAAGSGRRR